MNWSFLTEPFLLILFGHYFFHTKKVYQLSLLLTVCLMAIRFSHDNSQHHNFDNTWLDHRSSVHFMYFAIHLFNACPNRNVALGSPGVESGFSHDFDNVFFFFFTTDNKIGPNRRSILKRNLRPILKTFGF